jgi:hypothetical protein
VSVAATGAVYIDAMSSGSARKQTERGTVGEIIFFFFF